MPDLEHTYVDYDFTLLRAIAVQAGVDLAAPNPRAAAAELAQALSQPETIELLLTRAVGHGEDLSNDNPRAAALATLLEHAPACRFPAAAFTRRFGDVRPLGPGALAREQPWENPATVTEALYFNGLIGRAFLDSDTGPQEFFFIPSDLIPRLPPIHSSATLNPAQAIAPMEADTTDAHTASSLLVDDAVTVLAAIQLKPGRLPVAYRDDALAPYLRLPAFDLLVALFADLNFITSDHKLDPERVKPYLQASRADQLRTLADAWRGSKTWNDLLNVPALRAEPGAWRNDPIAARHFILRLCADLPSGEWRSLDSFVDFVREHHPDFQRPAGDYDSWYIRDAQTGEYLRGFDTWDRVDGSLIRYSLTGPMHWLGLADIRRSPDAFRLALVFPSFATSTPWQIAEKPQRIVCKHDGTLIVSRSVNRYERFQAARIGEWLTSRPAKSPTPKGGTGERSREPSGEGRPAQSKACPERSRRDADVQDYQYRLTGNSLQAAAAQGITAKHIVAFLRRACEHVPQHIVEMIERWGQNGIEARAANMTVLKLKGPDLLEKLMRSPKTRRWLGEAIGDRAAEVKDWEKLREAMAEMGLTAEFH
ncbi:MAG TPA: helicase-associated domain-containing protein [Anaerolineales bacterium]|nr:helicase-associated domain-containing protein [Anaerolineales bacterium]